MLIGVLADLRQWTTSRAETRLTPPGASRSRTQDARCHIGLTRPARRLLPPAWQRDFCNVHVLDRSRRMVQPRFVRASGWNRGAPVAHRREHPHAKRAVPGPSPGRGAAPEVEHLFALPGKHSSVRQACNVARRRTGQLCPAPAPAKPTKGFANNKGVVRMAFSESTKDAAYARSGGRCECERQDGLHHGQCPVRVDRHDPGVEYHHRIATDQGGATHCPIVRCCALPATKRRSHTVGISPNLFR